MTENDVEVTEVATAVLHLHSQRREDINQR